MSEAALKELGIPYERRADGTLFVPGDIDLSNRGLTELPDLSDVKVGGSFNCTHNKLTTLAGAPQMVEGSFSCDANHLTSLADAPQAVGMNFWCNNNQLTSLIGAPQTVGLNFYCNNNQLTSLEHAPQRFAKMISDWGTFKKWKDVPKELRTSPATRERMARDAFNQKVHRATVTQTSVKLIRKVR